MNKFAVAMLLAVVTVGMGVSVRAENLDDMRQLLSTGDCSDCDLSGVTLRQLDLSDADLEGANLSNVQFIDVQLMRADLEDANLSGAFFRGSDLTGATLKNANLANASSFFFCNGWAFGYYGEESSQEDIEECLAELLPVQMATELCRFQLESAGLVASGRREDESEWCNGVRDEALLYTSLYSPYAQMYLPGAMFRGANLEGANLTGANFSGVDFRYADLSDVEASTAVFDYALISEAIVDGATGGNFEGAWRSTAEVLQWIDAFQLAEEEERRRTEGRTYAGSINRAQQAYYIENNEFSTDLQALGLGLSSHDRLEFGLFESGRDEVAIGYVLAKESGVLSALGVVHLIEIEAGEMVTIAAVCESNDAIAMTSDEIPEIVIDEDDSVICPTGWTKL